MSFLLWVMVESSRRLAFPDFWVIWCCRVRGNHPKKREKTSQIKTMWSRHHQPSLRSSGLRFPLSAAPPKAELIDDF